MSASVSGSAEECSRDAQAICEGAGGAAERVAALARSSLSMSAGRARETEEKVMGFLLGVWSYTKFILFSPPPPLPFLVGNLDEACFFGVPRRCFSYARRNKTFLVGGEGGWLVDRHRQLLETSFNYWASSRVSVNSTM